jgi:hypothetical protein
MVKPRVGADDRGWSVKEAAVGSVPCRIATAVTLGLLVHVAGAATAQDAAEEPALREALLAARGIAGDLAGTIRGLLVEELQRGGYDGALRACSETAPRLTREWRQRTGNEARRVSLRQRNADNVPDAWERGALEEMERRKRDGQPVSEHYAAVEEDGRRVLRYLQPLLTAPVCLNCHGAVDDLAPEIRELLAQRYPGDRATGYASGDIRGAITVKVILPDASR